MNPYLSPRLVRSALRLLNIRPTRGMGQNFLADAHALDQIVTAAALTPADLVVEVGPGLGVLTWELLPRARQVIAIELDKRLAARLDHEFRRGLPPDLAQRLHIIQTDVLNVSPAAMLEMATSHQIDQGYNVVANLPYAITSPVLHHFLEQLPRPEVMVVLVQWEVAQRIAATPGDMSILAHIIQLYAAPEIVARVPGSCFIPQPAVDSAILRLRVHAQPAVDAASINGVIRTIKAGFAQPRKKLANSLPSGLASMGHTIERPQVLAVLEAASVSPDRRAETLSLAEWLAVYRQLQVLDGAVA
ncbi:MAG: 16S rRNA (adenine(1518)-N(6)/adenine(1519)-N(6))-dimethyltransferase RsmA [Chloroflexaceae bacterium]|nr:16S rRNA (adenine(1518)-N(6)/adenine(1519)-N(6))-dimethyltransferase RsmA [Chloroflexaceae bacterium]